MREPIYMPWYERRRRRRRVRTLAAILSVALVGGVLGYRVLADGGRGQPAHAAPVPPAADGDVARTVHVAIAEGEITPRKLVLERGRPVRLVVHNIGAFFHDLYVEDLDIHLHLWPDDRLGMRLVPNRAGTFKGGCISEDHADKEPFTVVVR
jgi:heme/copper-type cytochrome/quinol oxidase subunit 2